jgi:hypothetical protein
MTGKELGEIRGFEGVDKMLGVAGCEVDEKAQGLKPISNGSLVQEPEGSCSLR